MAFDHVEVAPAARGMDGLRKQFAGPLAILTILAGLVLLAACVNVANLMLARAAARQKEFAVRLAIGAGRGRLVRQTLTEAMVLVGIGAALGTVLAVEGETALARFFAEGNRQIVMDLSLNARTLLFTSMVSMLTGVLFGILPALRASRADPATGLRSGSRQSTANVRTLRAGRALMVLQVALSTVLLASAALFVRSLGKLEAVDLGFARGGVLTMDVTPERQAFGTPAWLALQATLLDRVRALPGVLSASWSTMSPLSGRDRARGSRWTDSCRRGRATTRSTSCRSRLDISTRMASGCWQAESSRRRIPPAPGRSSSSTRPRRASISAPPMRSASGWFFEAHQDRLRGRRRRRRRQARQPALDPVALRLPRDSPIHRSHQPPVAGGSDERRCRPALRAGAEGTDRHYAIAPHHQRFDHGPPGGELVDARTAAVHALGRVRRPGARPRVHRAVWVARIRGGATDEWIGIRMALGATRESAMWLVLREAITLCGVGILIGVPALAALDGQSRLSCTASHRSTSPRLPAPRPSCWRARRWRRRCPHAGQAGSIR